MFHTTLTWRLLGEGLAATRGEGQVHITSLKAGSQEGSGDYSSLPPTGSPVPGNQMNRKRAQISLKKKKNLPTTWAKTATTERPILTPSCWDHQTFAGFHLDDWKVDSVQFSISNCIAGVTSVAQTKNLRLKDLCCLRQFVTSGIKIRLSKCTVLQEFSLWREFSRTQLHRKWRARNKSGIS